LESIFARRSSISWKIFSKAASSRETEFESVDPEAGAALELEDSSDLDCI
jgi:hypothetical protein